jgi:molybdenum cofactor biosynthesis enzyme
METLTGLNIALLTIRDLVKPVEAVPYISNVRLLYKSGIWRDPDSYDSVVNQLLTEY